MQVVAAEETRLGFRSAAAFSSPFLRSTLLALFFLLSDDDNRPGGGAGVSRQRRLHEFRLRDIFFPATLFGLSTGQVRSDEGAPQFLVLCLDSVLSFISPETY
jgi:hypothetical protein